MSKIYSIYNPHAGNKLGEIKAEKLTSFYLNDEITYVDITQINNYSDFFEAIEPTATVIVCGGDGTLNRFINNIQGVEFTNDILYYATGSGNDFLRDMQRAEGDKPFSIKNEIKNLPIVTVNGNKYRFLNGVGYGIDGYCCEVGDKMREEDSTKKINYSSIAIKGLLFHYKPTNARVIVDGKEYSFKKVWICPTMVGRYYGGGMLPAPNQHREDRDKHISVSIIHGSGKLKTLMIFPSIFKGEHIKHTKNCTVLQGKHIEVEFDHPAPLQIDGETILNVTKYEVELSPVLAKNI